MSHANPCRPGTLRSVLAAVLMGISLAGAAPTAKAADYVAQANDLYRTIKPQSRSDLVILPLIAKMEAPPAVVGTPRQAALLPAKVAGWAEAESWAMSAPQRAVLEALDTITKVERIDEAFAFGQPYGAEAVGATSDGVALVSAGLYTELGDPPMLSAAQFLYLDGLDRVGCLANVEATRLAASGDVHAAAEVLLDWLYFSRQICDRAFFREARWGLQSMAFAAERLRDLLYSDFRAPTHNVTVDQIQAYLDRSREQRGYVSVERMMFPPGDRIGAQQVIERVFVARGGPNPDTFAATMSRLASTERPLRLFSEAARWDRVGQAHANWFDTNEQLERVYNDAASRWRLAPDDARLSSAPDMASMDAAKYAVIARILPELPALINDRQIVRTQIVGTRCSLGVMAYAYRSKDFPPTLTSIRPTFVKEIEADPYNRNRSRGLQPPLEYFVPIRDQFFGPRDQKRPHKMNVKTLSSTELFSVLVGDDQFILYSIGPDEEKGWADLVCDAPGPDTTGDLLIWPPVISLVRQRMVETGRFK